MCCYQIRRFYRRMANYDIQESPNWNKLFEVFVVNVKNVTVSRLIISDICLCGQNRIGNDAMEFECGFHCYSTIV